MNKLILMIEKNKFIAKVLRFLYRQTLLKYNKYHQNKIFLKYSRETLIQINKAFEELNIPYWLEYGTLLGAVRDKNFIKHDLDIDLGLYLNDYSSDISTVLAKYGFKHTRTISILDGAYGLEETYQYKDISIDLFYFTVNKNKMYSHVFKNKDGLSWHKTVVKYGGLIPSEIYFPYKGKFEEIIFLDHKFFVPQNPHEHLKAFYGDNYMIPDSSWNPYTMAKNITTLNNKIGVVQNYE